MRGYSLALVLLVGAVLAQADAYRRRADDEGESETQADSSGRSVEQPDPAQRHHHHHHNHHLHGLRDPFRRRNHHGFNLSQAEETFEFHRSFMRDVRRLARESGLGNADTNTLLNIFEENRPVFKREGRSQWTEEQWQKSKEERQQRKQLIKAKALEEIQDQAHVVVFFDTLEAQKKLKKEKFHKWIVGRLTRIARSNRLEQAQIEKFMRELESHKPVGVHWRPGMSANEKEKNIQAHIKNWQEIKEACLRDATEAEQTQFNKFFAAVEHEFAKIAKGEHNGHRHHHRAGHRRHHDDEDFSRHSYRRPRYHNDETEDLRSEVHRHRHHGRRHFDRDDSEEVPRHHRRSEDAEEIEEPRRHRRHHVLDEEDRDDEAGHHHKHHVRRHHRRHHENFDDSEEQRDEQPRRHRHHRESEENDSWNARSEVYRHPRRHFRRSDSAADE